jgi:predicted double-glycine peptidase
MKFEFSKWLSKNETSTSTGDIAGFARPMMGVVRRDWLGVWGADDPFFHKNRKKRHNRFQEAKEGNVSEYRRIPDGVIKIQVPNVQQTKNFSCGAAATQSVCCYFGVGPENQEEYVKRLKTEPNGGTAPADIVKFCKSHNLSVKKVVDMTVDQLTGYLESGKPVICAMQAHGTKKDYKNWTSGHYVVAIGYDDKHIYFEDPMSTGRRMFLPIHEFEERWHDYDKHGNEYDNLGIVVWKRGHPGYPHKAKKMD